MRDLDHDGAVVILLLLRLFWWLRHQGIQTPRRHRRDDHEHDQQHEQNIDHRSYVDACIEPTTTACIKCHFVSLISEVLCALGRRTYCPAGGVAAAGLVVSCRRSVSNPT